MMILKSILTAIAALSLAAGTASADQGQAGQEEGLEQVSNVLILKLMKGEASQGQQGQQGQETEEAYLVPLTVEKIPVDKEGNVDTEALADLCEDMEDTAEWIKLDHLGFDESVVPQEVMQEFANGEAADLDELKQRLSWRVWTPFGSIGNRGYYGYGYRGGYGWNNNYRNYYPRYGYWSGSRHYRYQPSWYNRYRGGYNNHYYYRR